MNSKEKTILMEILERVARIEEQGKSRLETLKEIKKHIEVINSEMGTFDKRLDKVESLYFETKSRYDRMSLYWKAATFIISPAVTFLFLCFLKFILGLPVP